MKILRESKRQEHVGYMHHFDYVDDPRAGYVFDCDALGRLRNPEAAQKNYDACLTGGINGRAVLNRGLQTHKWSSFLFALIKCGCGAEVELTTNSNCCDSCGQRYNMSGQVLVEPRFWDKETGESPGEIMMEMFDDDK